MLPIALNTNEVKDAAGVEVEFNRQSAEGRKVVFAKIDEAPNLQHRLTVSHVETGVGTELRRRSLIRVDKQALGVSGKTRTHSAYLVVDLPAGDISDTTVTKDALANLMSFIATTGSGTTVLFDCTGTGASAAIAGTL